MFRALLAVPLLAGTGAALPAAAEAAQPGGAVCEQSVCRAEFTTPGWTESTVPQGVHSMTVRVWGAGGGGAGSATGGAGGGGGGTFTSPGIVAGVRHGGGSGGAGGGGAGGDGGRGAAAATTNTCPRTSARTARTDSPVLPAVTVATDTFSSTGTPPPPDAHPRRGLPVRGGRAVRHSSARAAPQPLHRPEATVRSTRGPGAPRRYGQGWSAVTAVASSAGPHVNLWPVRAGHEQPSGSGPVRPGDGARPARPAGRGSRSAGVTSRFRALTGDLVNASPGR